jgi:hypothetical protein
MKRVIFLCYRRKGSSALFMLIEVILRNTSSRDVAMAFTEGVIYIDTYIFFLFLLSSGNKQATFFIVPLICL